MGCHWLLWVSVNHELGLKAAFTTCVCAVFITANVSGGHLNPAVTLATIFTGHIKVTRGLAYMFLQICGACFGILMVVSLPCHQLVVLTRRQQSLNGEHCWSELCSVWFIWASVLMAAGWSGARVICRHG